MSYILDALRKAAAERERGITPPAPSPLASQAKAMSHTLPQDDLVRKTKFWFYVAVGIVLVLVIALACLLGWRFVKEKSTASASPTAHQISATNKVTMAKSPAQEKPQTNINRVSDPAEAPATPTPILRPTTVASQPSMTTGMAVALPPPVPALWSAATTQPVNAPVKTLDNAADAVASAVQTVTAPQPPLANKINAKPPMTTALKSKNTTLTVVISPSKTGTSKSGASIATAQPMTARVYNTHELPDDIRARLPKFNISGASYSENPAHRMLIANGQIFHETEEVVPGLQVARINAKDAVFKFEGYEYSQSYP